MPRVQSRETEKLIRRNDKLTAENASLKRELSLHKQSEEEMAKKVNVYQKTIQTLMTKLAAVGSEHDAELDKRDAQGEDAERDRTELLQEREVRMQPASYLSSYLPPFSSSSPPPPSCWHHPWLMTWHPPLL